MIFDANYVTGLVDNWKRTQDPKLLEVILDQSKSLVEAIVSGYDSFYRDDLIQEASLRIQYALPYFDRSRSNLYNFLTTVIKNICMTYLRKQSKYNAEFPLEIYEFSTAQEHDVDNTDIVQDLIIRNRIRFPSIPVCTIDDISELICDALLYDANKRTIVSKLVDVVGIDKASADFFYTSSMLYLRSKYATNSEDIYCDEELSLCRDLQEIFGKEVGTHISIIFSGMTVRLQ